MNKTRLEAFSDGVFAIIITIMVLELRAPKSTEWSVVLPLLPVFFCYLLSFVFIAIYWGNHHHILHTITRVDARIMWANMHLLFWLSLVPFVTAWMGNTGFDKLTVAVYGGLLAVCGLSYNILSMAIKRHHTTETALTKAIAKGNTKGLFSLLMYLLSIPMALLGQVGISATLFVVVAIMWMIPSTHIERALMNADEHNKK